LYLSNRKWRKLLSEKLHNVCPSPDMFKVNNQEICHGRGLQFMEEMRNAYNMLLDELEVRDHLGDLGVDGRMQQIKRLKFAHFCARWLKFHVRKATLTLQNR
jgi:hypothetical protein